MKRRKNLSDDDVLRMEKMYENPNYSLGEIANKIGCSIITVEKRATKHGWCNPLLNGFIASVKALSKRAPNPHILGLSEKS